MQRLWPSNKNFICNFQETLSKKEFNDNYYPQKFSKTTPRVRLSFLFVHSFNSFFGRYLLISKMIVSNFISNFPRKPAYSFHHRSTFFSLTLTYSPGQYLLTITSKLIFVNLISNAREKKPVRINRRRLSKTFDRSSWITSPVFDLHRRSNATIRSERSVQKIGKDKQHPEQFTRQLYSTRRL